MNLSDQLDRAVTHVTPSADLLDEVRAGGRARLRRRRAGRGTVAGAAVLALAGAGLALLPSTASPGPRDTLGPVVTGSAPTPRTAAESAFAAAALRLWNAHPSESDPDGRGFFDDVQGPAQLGGVVATDVGLAAYVSQRVVLSPNANSAESGAHTLHGFFREGPAGTPVIIGTDYVKEADPLQSSRVGGWWVDEAHTLLAVVTEGQPLAVSRRWTYTADGRALRTDWEPVRDRGDGIGTVSTTPSSSLLLGVQPFTRFADRREVVGGPPPENASTRPNTYQAPDRRFVTTGSPWLGRLLAVGGASATGELTSVVQPPEEALRARSTPAEVMSAGSLWALRGPGFIVLERQVDTDPSRLYALVGDRVLDGGALDRDAPLPIALRLPDARGWVVGSPGATLRWRQGNGAWTSIADHALLPDGDDLSVEVTRSGGDPVVVRLR